MPAISRIFIARASRLFLILFLLTGVVAASVRFAPVGAVQRESLPVISASSIPVSGVKATTRAAMASPEAAAVEGWVHAKDNLAPVAGATVRLGDATTQTNEQGYFAFGAGAASAVRPASTERSWALSARVE